MENRKKYLFASYTDFGSGRLTGAHRRFLELLTCVAQSADVEFVGRPAPQLDGAAQVTLHPIDPNAGRRLPKHLAGGFAIYKALRKNKSVLNCDYAVSFSPVTTICYRMAGVKHIVSLFREDLIGYQKALQASSKKIAYFQFQERLAVKASEKIIVQCENDRNNLIARNERYCKNLADKVFIQINNANASWMNTDSATRPDNGLTPKILFIGNFSDRRKGHFFLLPAAMRLLDEGFRFELICVGGGRELELWQKKCENYPAIQFPGQVNNMKEYLVRSDMMLVPSLIDSCPNTVLEGLNAGIAVYGANTGGIPDLLRHDEYLFEPNEQSVYAFMKDVLVNNRYQFDAVRQQARKESLCFDWGDKIKKLIEL